MPLSTFKADPCSQFFRVADIGRFDILEDVEIGVS